MFIQYPNIPLLSLKSKNYGFVLPKEFVVLPKLIDISYEMACF